MPKTRFVPLSEILHGFPLPLSGPVSSDVFVSGVVSDSRQVQPGSLFVALCGGTFDGHRFIPAAVQAGAAAVVGEQALDGLPVPFFRVENSRQALAYLAAGYYGFPAHHLTVIGITGTDGKTSTSNLLYQVLITAGLAAGMISTVNAVIGSQVLDTGFHVTTPDAPDVQRYLAQMAAAGLTHVILEVTSHGLAQHRVDACEFDMGVITNITHEHLDYHGTVEAYREAKGRLFRELARTPAKDFPTPRLAVLNRDDSSYEFLASIAQVRQVDYGFDSAAQVRAEQVEHTPHGLRFTAQGPGYSQAVESRLVGDFNVSNCLAALAAGVHGLGLDPQTAAAGVAALQGVPGRMEWIDLGQDFAAIVDFAHTPNALRAALRTARQVADKQGGRVIAVFGSAGLRDRQKRRMMAEVAAQEADLSVLTAEDPRSDSLEGILTEMALGAESQGGEEGATFYRVPDRREALRFAVRQARPGDVVIACGKGHEQSMCFGEIEYLWDDRTALRAALAEHLGQSGPDMPALPDV